MQSKTIIIVLFTLFVCIQVLSQPVPTNYIRTIYISSSEGNDLFPGTLTLPRRTIASLTDKERTQSRILLKSGDIFYENINNCHYCEIGTYGKGSSPILTGLFMLKNTNAWEKLNNNIWRLDFSKIQNFTGFAYSNHTFNNQTGNIGCIYDAKNRHIYGNLVSHPDSLKSDGDYFISRTYKREQTGPDTFRYLLFRYSTNPGLLGNLCFTAGAYGPSKLFNTFFHDISIIGFGYHALTALDSTLVSRCNIDMIGGSILLDYEKWIRFGNGVEVNVSHQPRFNVLVENCTISRTYDTATTIQGSRNSIQNPGNIRFTSNNILHCRQAFEWYMNSVDTQPQYIDCQFTNNIIIYSGENLFNIPHRMNDCCFLTYQSKPSYIDISGNVCIGSNYYCAVRLAPSLHDNKLYLSPQNYLCIQDYYQPQNAIYPHTEDDIQQFRAFTMDNSSLFPLTEKIIKQYNYQRLMKQIHRNINQIIKSLNNLNS